MNEDHTSIWIENIKKGTSLKDKKIKNFIININCQLSKWIQSSKRGYTNEDLQTEYNGTALTVNTSTINTRNMHGPPTS